MAIELIKDLKTVRTYPRVMKHKASDNIAMALHDDEGGIVWLSGSNAGILVGGSIVDWKQFEDFHGSVTLHNKD